MRNPETAGGEEGGQVVTRRRYGPLLAVPMIMVSLCRAGTGAAAPGLTTLEPGVLKVCLYPGFAPFAIKGASGWSGWDPDYLSAFATTAGLRFEPVEVATFNDIWMRPGVTSATSPGRASR